MSWFYKWLARIGDPAPTVRAQRRALLDAEVRRLFEASGSTYGSPRIHLDLAEAGWTVPVNTVADSMRRQGLVGRKPKRYRRGLTRQDKAAPKFPDLLNRDFTAPAPNLKWCGDMTEIPTDEGKLYLRDPGHLLPLRHRVDDRESGERRSGRSGDPSDLRQTGHRPQAAHDPRRPRLVDDLQTGRVPAGRPRRDAVAFPAARQRRQPLQRGPVQDAEVPARLPRPVRLHRGRPCPLRPVLRLVTTTSTATPGWVCTPRPTSTTGPPRSSATNAPRSSPTPSRLTRNASSASPRPRRRCRPRRGSTSPRRRRTRLSNNEPKVP